MKVFKDRITIGEIAGTGLGTAAIAAVFLAVSPFVIAYKSYKFLRKTFDREYDIADRVNRTRRALRESIEDITPLTMLHGDYNPDLMSLDVTNDYRQELRNAISFYERRKEFHCANEFVSELNAVTRKKI